jgi:hypothetical protein
VNGNGSNERMDRVERALERIAERHEALAQTVEILGHGMEELRAAQKVTEQRMAELVTMMTRLGNIVIRHEERLDALDGGDQ